MTIVPSFASACQLADELPDMVADFLELDHDLSRRFREDSLTDIIIASFLQLPRGRATILTPSEAVTGSDFDLVIGDPIRRTGTHYRIQAKRLYMHPTKWDLSVYRELAHPHGTGGQAQLLCDPANLSKPAPTIPLYAFYNPAPVCAQAGVPGIALADAYTMKSAIDAGIKNKPTRPSFRRLTALQSHFFPMSAILCPPLDASGKRRTSAITPEESRRGYEQASGRSGEDAKLRPAATLPADYVSFLLDAETTRVRRQKATRTVILLRGESSEDGDVMPAAPSSHPTPELRRQRESRES